MSCDKYRDLMVEALYGELDPETARAFDAHTTECSECAALRDEMRATLAAMNERRRPDPGEEYWHNYHARLEERMDRERSAVDGARDTARRRSNVSWGYRVAAAVAVLAVGVWIGRSMGPDTAREQPGLTIARNQPADTTLRRAIPADSTPVETPRGSQRDPIDGPSTRDAGEPAGQNPQLASADQRARDYIGRSQVLLLALVNASQDTTGAPAQFALQRERADMLVQEASVLREDLPGSDNRRMRELVTSLQMILREIANLETQNDFEAVKIIRNRVDREGVLLQIDVEQMRADENAGKEPDRGGAID